MERNIEETGSSSFKGKVKQLDFVVGLGTCFVMLTNGKGPEATYVNLETTEHQIQTILETALSRTFYVEVGYGDKEDPKRIYRAKIDLDYQDV
jgi:hypothetical protein